MASGLRRTDSHNTNPLHLLHLPSELRCSVYEKYLEAPSTVHKATNKPQSSPQHFNFFGLPFELRLCIYEYLLKPAKIDVYSYDHSEYQDEVKEDSKATHPYKPVTFYARWIGPKRLNPAILRTCKTVHAEAWKIPYRPFALTLRPAFQYVPRSEEHEGHNSDLRTLCRIPRPFGIWGLACVQKLSKLELELYTTFSTQDEDIAHSEALFEPFRRKNIPIESKRIQVGRLELKIFNKFFGQNDEEQRKVEKSTTLTLLDPWIKVLAPKEVHVLIGNKPGFVMRCRGKEDGLWTVQSLAELTGK